MNYHTYMYILSYKFSKLLKNTKSPSGDRPKILFERDY